MDSLEKTSLSLLKDKYEEKLREMLNNIKLMTHEEYEALDDKDRTYFLEVYEVISSMQAERAKYLKAYTEAVITKSAVVDQVKFSRRTLYNKPIIMKFIEMMQIEDEETNPYNRIDKLENRIKELNKMIMKMVARDVEIEKLKIQIDNLIEDITNKEKDNNRLEAENEKYLLRIAKLEGIETNVVKLPKKNNHNKK